MKNKKFLFGLFLLLGISGLTLPVGAEESINPINVTVSCTADAKSTYIRWTNPNINSLEQFKIYRSEILGELGAIVSPVGGASWLGSNNAGKSTSYTDAAIVDGKKYYYTVKIRTLNGSESTDSTQYTSNCGLNPTNISTACAADNKSIAINWVNPNINSLEQFKIYRSETLGELGAIVSPVGGASWLDQDDAGLGTTYRDASFITGKKYYYTVKLKTVSGNESTDNTQYTQQCGTGSSADINPTNVSVA